MVIWQLPRALPGGHHRLKYRLFYAMPGRRLIGYDNDAGKGDHRHLKGKETSYQFTTPERLVADFLADVRKMRGKRP
jgi:hypothetical protein